MKGEFKVGEFRVRPRLNELLSPEGEPVRVEPKSMMVLVALAEQPGEVFTRQELLDAVWGEAFVTEEVLSHAIWNLRRGLGDDARKPRLIQTIPRTGYRLMVPVTRPEETRPEDESSESLVESDPVPEIAITELEKETDPRPAPRSFRWRLAAGAALALALVAAFFQWNRTSAPPSLHVAVPEPRLAADADADLGFVASGVQVAVLDTLASVAGFAVWDSAQIGEVGEKPQEVARAAAADEVLGIVVEDVAGREGLCRVTLRRYLGTDGRVLWNDSFEVDTAPAAARLLADTVRARLLAAYPARRQRDGRGGFEVSEEDYLRFLRIRQRFDQGEKTTAESLRELETLLHSSPRFLEGYLLAVRISTQLYRDSRDLGFLERGLVLASRAVELAPTDPRSVLGRFEIELARERFDRAAALLESLESRLTSEERLLEQSELEVARGDLDAALDLRRRLAEIHPSWRNLYRLAQLEQRQGDFEAARRHLEALLERAPDNGWGLSKLAEIELGYGDLGRAESLYVELLERGRHRNYLINLGIVRFLDGRFEAAAVSYREALQLAPDHPLVLLNLAQAELALGKEERARDYFRQALQRFEGLDSTAALSATDQMARAICLARLGDHRRAVELAQETRLREPRDPEVAYQAALVYSLVGDHLSALVSAEKALRLGMRPRWFRVPGFEPLVADPDFAALLERAHAHDSGEGLSGGGSPSRSMTGSVVSSRVTLWRTTAPLSTVSISKT